MLDRRSCEQLEFFLCGSLWDLVTLMIMCWPGSTGCATCLGCMTKWLKPTHQTLVVPRSTLRLRCA